MSDTWGQDRATSESMSQDDPYDALREAVARHPEDEQAAQELLRLACARLDRPTFLLAARALGLFLAEDLTEAMEGNLSAVARYLDALKRRDSLDRLSWEDEAGVAHSGPALLARLFGAIEPHVPIQLRLRLNDHPIALDLPRALVLHFLADIVDQLARAHADSPAHPMAARAVALLRQIASTPSPAHLKLARQLAEAIARVPRRDPLGQLALAAAEAAHGGQRALFWRHVELAAGGPGWRLEGFEGRAFLHFLNGLAASLRRLGDHSPFHQLKRLSGSLMAHPGLKTTPVDILRPLPMKPWDTDTLLGLPPALSADLWPSLHPSLLHTRAPAAPSPQGDDRMEHLATITLPPAADDHAVALFLSHLSDNEASRPHSHHARVVLLPHPAHPSIPGPTRDDHRPLERARPPRGVTRTSIHVPVHVFDDFFGFVASDPAALGLTQDVADDIERLRELLIGFSVVGGGPLGLTHPTPTDKNSEESEPLTHGPRAPDEDLGKDSPGGAYLMRLSASLFGREVHFGPHGVLHVFADTAFWRP